MKITSAASIKVKPKYFAKTIPFKYSPRLAAYSSLNLFLKLFSIISNSSLRSRSKPNSSIIL